MEAKEKEILNELISGTKCQFVIPVFQRNYDWRIKDCDRLFDDIEDLARDEDHSDRKHFMGAFVCKFTKFVDTSFNQFVLIDGQQRLTSITLLLKALYDFLGEFGEKYKETQDEIKETYLINKFAKEANLRLKLKPNKVDNDNFSKLMNGEDVDPESSIGRNYNNFLKRLKGMKVSVESFYNAMQRLEGVAVFLDDTDNPQVIFESLNSTGLELTDADLIRNYLLMNCKADEQEKYYKDYWLKVEEILKDNFLQFIRDFLSLKNGIVTSGTKNYTYTTFQKFYRAGKYDKESFLKDLLNYSKIYKRLINPQADSKNLLAALTDYVSLDIKTSYPFVFGLLIDNTEDSDGNKKISDDDLAKIIRLLESYLIRRNVCNLAGGGLSQTMASLYNDLKVKFGEKFYNDPYSKVSMALAGIRTKAYFPKDEEFSRELVSRDMFHSKNISFILQKMEMAKQGKEIVDLSSLTVEHVMPQTLSEEWIKYLNREDYEKFHSDYVNRIGNLTLTAYNSEMSNKLYKEKKVHMDFSRLVLNSYFAGIEDWKDEEAINKRAGTLSQTAISLWPYPAATSIEDIATESHFLLDDEDYEYMGTTPAGILIKDKKIIKNQWSDLYIACLNYLYELNKDYFISLFNNKDYFYSEKKMLSKVNDFRTGQEIADGWFTETNTNTESKIKNLKQIFTDFQFEPDDIIVYIK